MSAGIWITTTIATTWLAGVVGVVPGFLPFFFRFFGIRRRR